MQIFQYYVIVPNLKSLETHVYTFNSKRKLFKNLPNDLFITRIAHNPYEACSFIEVGFEYVSGAFNDGGQIFRKRK
jgi:hypothetical protein